MVHGDLLCMCVQRYVVWYVIICVVHPRVFVVKTYMMQVFFFLFFMVRKISLFFIKNLHNRRCLVFIYLF